MRKNFEECEKCPNPGTICYNGVVRKTLRVIAGWAKGRRLKAPKGDRTRPTTDRVKEAIFNILGPLVIEGRFLDLFAGTGAIGIEALSRGATEAVFVEERYQVAQVIKENLALTGFSHMARLIVGDVFTKVQQLEREGQHFNIIYADPPYGQGLAQRLMEQLAQTSLLAAGGVVIIETGSKEDVPSSLGNFERWKQVKYGDTMLSFYQLIGKSHKEE